MLKINLEKAVSAIREKKAKIVLLELPEGLKTRNIAIAKELGEKTSAQIISRIDPCFGACGLNENMAKQANADLIVHLGHTQFFSPETESFFVPLEYEIDRHKIKETMEECAKQLKEKKIGSAVLCSAIQYTGYLEEAKKLLEKKGIKTEIAEGKGVEKGQILGCNYSSAKSNANAIVFLGDGLFHPLGIAFSSEKKVFIANPLEKECRALSKEKGLFLKKRFAVISQAMEAQNFGILISSKKGQFRMKKALELKGLIEKHHKKAFLFTGDLIKPDYLLGLEIDAFVCTACPRIAIDDSSSYAKPMLTPNELKIVLGEKKEYSTDEF